MRALAANPYSLHDFDRFGWIDADPDPEAMERRRQRTKRRELINSFLARRDYWNLMNWLAAKMPSHRRFLTIGEALALARFEYDRCPSDDWRMVVTVARYFDLAGREWL